MGLFESIFGGGEKVEEDLENTESFFSKEAGQKRTEALNKTINENLDYYLGPTGIPDKLRSANELLNPVVGISDAGQAVEEGRYLDAVTETAAAALPVAGAIAAKPLVKGIASVSDDVTDAATALKETMLGGSFNPDRRKFVAAAAASPAALMLPPMDEVATAASKQLEDIFSPQALAKLSDEDFSQMLSNLDEKMYDGELADELTEFFDDPTSMPEIDNVLREAQRRDMYENSAFNTFLDYQLPETSLTMVPDGGSPSAISKIIDEPEIELPPAANSQKTQIAGTLPTYKKADALLTDLSGEGSTLDYGAGLGLSQRELGYDTFEPFPREGFEPTFNSGTDIPEGSYKRITNLNVLNVVPKETRDEIVKDIGRILQPDGTAIITTRGRDVLNAKGDVGPEAMSLITSAGTYQKGFTQSELREYVQETLGDNFEVVNNKLGAAGVTIRKKSSGTVSATVAEQTDSAFDLPTPTTPREGPPEPYVMDGAKIAADLENTVSAQEVATGVKKPAGAKFSGLTAQQSTLLPNHYSEGLKSTQTIKPVKINWEALEGKTVFSVVGDPTSANTVTKVQGDKLITPVESQAGVEFMDKQDYGYASAQQAMASTHNEIVRAMDEDGADPLLMYLQMAEVSGDFADHTGMLIGELFKQARISSNAVPAIDEHIRKIGMDKVVPKLDSNGEKIWDAKNKTWKTKTERIRPFTDFKSVADPLYMARYIAELPTGSLRAGLIKGLDRHGLQQKGVPNVGDVRLALMNPDLFGKDWLSAGERLIIPDMERGLFPTPEGLHNTYDTTIGKVGQSMKVDSDGIPMNLILQDMSEAQRAKGTGGRLIPTSADYKVAEASPRRSQQLVDGRIIELAMSFEEMSEKYGRGAALSFAQDLLLNEKITSETIKAAKKANAKPWVLSLMAGVMATQAIMESEDGLMSPTEEEI
jgi:hypothetical protein